MLYNTKEFNKKIQEIKDAWKKRRKEKLRCKTCNYKSMPHNTCHLCEEELSYQDQEPRCSETQEEEKLEMQYDCEDCGEELRCRMESDCEECGEGMFIEDQEICLLGLDVVALFPSMQSKTTGKIIHQQVLKSPIDIQGFNWKQGARYIVVNRKYTGDLKCLWNILPWRRKVGGTAPGMKSKEMNSKTGNVEMQWNFPRAEPTEKQIREIVARVAEIGVRFLSENCSYKFAGDAYQQASGGPIGARVTMAAARIVMSDWGEK
jgi:hypothetical protein